MKNCVLLLKNNCFIYSFIELEKIFNNNITLE